MQFQSVRHSCASKPPSSRSTSIYSTSYPATGCATGLPHELRPFRDPFFATSHLDRGSAFLKQLSIEYTGRQSAPALGCPRQPWSRSAEAMMRSLANIVLPFSSGPRRPTAVGAGLPHALLYYPLHCGDCSRRLPNLWVTS